MLIVLGIAIATFLSLIVGRLAWKLALRIGAKRVQRNVPVTVVDLQNDRDRLRAEQAILSRKIEVRLDEMKLRMAEQAAEVTRNRNRIELLMQQIADQDSSIASRDAEIARLSSVVSSQERELANYRAKSDGLQQALTAKDVEVAGLQEKFLAKLDEAKLIKPPALTTAQAQAAPAAQPLTMDEATTRLTNRIRTLTGRPEVKPADTASPPSNTGSSFETGRILVKPAGTQEVQSKAKAKTSKKAPRIEKETPAIEVVDTGNVVSLELAQEAAAKDNVETAPVATEATQTETAATAPVTAESGKSVVTNVISLAQRIKALQREIAS